MFILYYEEITNHQYIFEFTYFNAGIEDWKCSECEWMIPGMEVE